jgi:multidrug efflux pump subunit AcrA (membrane-fusion protein)
VIDQGAKTLERRQVTTGDVSEFGVLIRTGLSAGDQIVVAGVSMLTEGQAVAPMDDGTSS